MQNLHEILNWLEEKCTAQNRKIYQRHEASKNCFGVNFANLKAAKKND